MSNSTSLDIRQRYVDVLGAEEGGKLHLLREKFFNLKYQWQKYEFLFGKNSERVDLLNRTGGSIFYYFEKALFESTIIGICRLFDPIKSMGRPNLTLLMLNEFKSDRWPHSDIKPIIEEAKNSIGAHRNWRNRRIAHNDLNIAEKIEQLDPQNRQNINITIQKTFEIFRMIEFLLFNAEISGHIMSRIPDETTLIYNLYIADLENKKKLNRGPEYIYSREILPPWLFDERR